MLGFKLFPSLQSTLWIVPRAKVVLLSFEFLASIPSGMSEEREALTWLLWLLFGLLGNHEFISLRLCTIRKRSWLNHPVNTKKGVPQVCHFQIITQNTVEKKWAIQNSNL